MSPADGFDAVVVGAGPNGLVAALRLARRGRRVLVVEAADRVGGALRSAELTLPGFLHDVGATVLPLALASPAFRELDPAAHGVEWSHPPIPAAHPMAGEAVLVYRDLDRTADALGRDARAWRALVGGVTSGGQRLVDALLSPLSPGLAVRAAPALVRYGMTGILPAEVVARTVFRTPQARAVFAGMAGHSVLSLRQLATAGYGSFMAGLAHQVGWPVVRGGSENLAIWMATSLRALGGEIHTGTAVRHLSELPPARSVLLDLTPRQVLAIAGDRLPAGYQRRLGKFRHGPGVFKLDWALDGPVPWHDPRVGQAGTVHLGGTLQEIVSSERDVAAGRHPTAPYVLCVQPTVADPTRAPAGKHTFWAYCHVPNGSTRDMTGAIESQIERFAPGFGERVLARHALGPAALEGFDANLIGGDLGGGSADLRQFVSRPVLSPRPWATPVRGLYICSSSTPPGGGVHGMGGWHAAQVALRD